MKIPLDQIIIGDRQRLDLGDLEDLNSMADPDVRQILPIVVHRVLPPNGGFSYELIDGRRRLAKATALGWSSIEAYEQDQLTPLQKQKMELLADIGRKDRTWQETAIAYCKIHDMEARERSGTGETWGKREFARFLNISLGKVSQFLNYGRMLLQTTPRDEELWACDGPFSAYKLLLNRQTKEVQRDLERRRQVAVGTTTFVSSGGENIQSIPKDSPLGELFVPDERGPVHVMNTTPPEEEVSVLIHGYNKAFEDAVPDVDFGVGTAWAVLTFRALPTLLPNIRLALRPTGWAVLWASPFEEPCLRQLIWNQIRTQPGLYPFDTNYEYGMLIGTARDLPEPHGQETASATISSFPCEDPLELPAEVVDYTLSAICPPNLAVLCPCNAPVVAVAQTGRIPIWFEADKERFDKKCEELKEYYERTIPGVVVKMRGEA